MTEAKIEKFFLEEVGREDAEWLTKNALDALIAIRLLVRQQSLFELWDALGCDPNRSEREELLYQALGPLKTLRTINFSDGQEFPCSK